MYAVADRQHELSININERTRVRAHTHTHTHKLYSSAVWVLPFWFENSNSKRIWASRIDCDQKSDFCFYLQQPEAQQPAVQISESIRRSAMIAPSDNPEHEAPQTVTYIHELAASTRIRTRASSGQPAQVLQSFQDWNEKRAREHGGNNIDIDHWRVIFQEVNCSNAAFNFECLGEFATLYIAPLVQNNITSCTQIKLCIFVLI